MKSNINRVKLPAVALVAVAFLMTLVLTPAAARTSVDNKPFDAAAVYKSKCASCHGKQAEKKFDKTKTDDALSEVVLKGKDAKPLKMPAYETKGVTPEQAGALVAQMRTLNP